MAHCRRMIWCFPSFARARSRRRVFRLGHGVCASNRLFRRRHTDQMIEKLLEIAIRITSRANTLEGPVPLRIPRRSMSCKDCSDNGL
jgi:hypothetical protein